MTTAVPVGSPTSLHALHAVEATVFLVVVLVGVGLVERLAQLGRRPRRPPLPRRALLAVAAAAAGAGVVHLLVAPAHFHEDPLYGAFFLLTAATQLTYAALVMCRPQRLPVVPGVLGNAALLVLWGLSRTVGLPVGVDSGRPEAVGAVDLLAVGLELVVVTVGVLALRAHRTTAGAAPVPQPT